MDRLFSKNFVMLALAAFCSANAFMLLLPVLPIFALMEVHLAEGSVGLIVGAFSLSALICRPFIGYFLDNHSRKTLLIISMALFVASFSSYIFVSTVAMLLAVRMLHGASWASISTSNATIVADILPPKRLGEGIGYFALTMPLAMVVGPAIGIGIYDATESFNCVFTVCIILSFIAFILVCFLTLPKNRHHKSPLVLSIPALYEKKALGLAFMQFCYSFAYSGIVTFLPLFAVKYGHSNTGGFFILYAVSMILSRFVVRRTLDLRGPGPLVYAGYTFFALGVLALAVLPISAAFFASGMLAGFGGGIIMPTLNTMTMNVVESSARGKANATLFTAMDVGMGGGALIIGYIIQHTSYKITYVFTAIFLIIPMIWFLAAGKRQYTASMDKLRTKEQ